MSLPWIIFFLIIAIFAIIRIIVAINNTSRKSGVAEKTLIKNTSVNPTTNAPPATISTSSTSQKEDWGVWDYTWRIMVTAVIGALAILVIVLAYNRYIDNQSEDNTDTETVDNTSVAKTVPSKKNMGYVQQPISSFSSGQNYIPIPKEGLICYLDPMKTHTRPVGTVKYTLISNPSKWIIETGPTKGNTGIDIHKWYQMPAGLYRVTAISKDAYFRWYQ